MTSIDTIRANSRLRVLVVAAVIGAGLAMAIATPAAPAPVRAAASERAGSDAETKPGAPPRSQFPGFLAASTIVGTTVASPGTPGRGFVLREGAEGPFTPIDFPATGINDRGQIVGIYTNPNAAPDGQQSPMRLPMMMSGSDD